MAVILFVALGLIAVVGIFLVLRNYRRQSDYREGPGKVPEDYS